MKILACMMIFIMIFISPIITAIAVGIFIFECTAGFIPFVVIGSIFDFIIILIIALVTSYHLILSLEW